MKLESKVVNLSGEPIRNSLPQNFKKVVILPDYSPNKGLATGTVTVFDAKNHKIDPSYLGSDVGCGMLLAKFENQITDLEKNTAELCYFLFDKQDNTSGSLGGGNHFITIYDVVSSENSLLSLGEEVVLIHSGARGDGINFYRHAQEENYLIGHDKVMEQARKNRLKLLEIIKEKYKINAKPILDRAHNTLEAKDSELIYRKGAVKILPEELAVIPSSMAGNAALVRAKPEVSELKYSLCHATGRKVPRGKTEFFFEEGEPQNIFFPLPMGLEHYNSELPQNYRELNEILEKIKPYASIEAELRPKASIML